MSVEDRDAQLRQRQYDVYTAAEAARARRELRWTRALARDGRLSFNDIRRAQQQYRRARAAAPVVWRWGPNPDAAETGLDRKAA